MSEIIDYELNPCIEEAKFENQKLTKRNFPLEIFRSRWKGKFGEYLLYRLRGLIGSAIKVGNLHNRINRLFALKPRIPRRLKDKVAISPNCD